MEIADLRDYPQHLETLAGWHFAQWGHHVPGGCTIDRYRDELKESLGKEGIPTTFLALDDDQPLGSASLVKHDMSTRTDLTPWLASVYTDPEQRKRGIGRTLVRAVMDLARLEGVATLYLFTPDRQEFYQHLGWRHVEDVVYRGESVSIMSIDLKEL